MLESEVVKMFLESLPEEERGFAEIGKWSDFSACCCCVFMGGGCSLSSRELVGRWQLHPEIGWMDGWMDVALTYLSTHYP